MARRLVTPVVFVVVGLTLLLPFASLRFEVPAGDDSPPLRYEATYVGIAPASGRPAHLSLSIRDEGGNWAEEQTGDERILERADDNVLGARTFTLLALVLLAVGLVAATLPAQRWRAMLSAASALLAALALLAATLRVHQVLSAYLGEELLGGYDGDPSLVEFRYGFWIAAGLLVVVGFANVAMAVPGPSRTAPVAVGVN